MRQVRVLGCVGSIQLSAVIDFNAIESHFKPPLCSLMSLRFWFGDQRGSFIVPVFRFSTFEGIVKRKNRVSREAARIPYTHVEMAKFLENFFETVTNHRGPAIRNDDHDGVVTMTNGLVVAGAWCRIVDAQEAMPDNPGRGNGGGHRGSRRVSHHDHFGVQINRSGNIIGASMLIKAGTVATTATTAMNTMPITTATVPLPVSNTAKLVMETTAVPDTLASRSRGIERHQHDRRRHGGLQFKARRIKVVGGFECCRLGLRARSA